MRSPPTDTSQSRWPMFRHVERRASRMNEMMNHLDVDPVKLARQRAGDAYAEARGNCLNCSTAHECLYWLEAAGSRSEPPDFCPNIELFHACRRDTN